MKTKVTWNRRSRRVISGGHWIHVALLTLLMMSTVTAQETVNSEEEEFVLQSGQVGRDQVLAIMASEVVLAPGVGLRNLRLGEPLADVQNRLGPPKRIERSGLLRNIIGLVYTLDSGTEIAVIGRDVVERINVLGNSSQLVRTAQGARFGMQPNLILRIYREPSRTKDNRMEYEHLGINFHFQEGKVARMDLYPREK